MAIIDCYGEIGPQPYPTQATTIDAVEKLMTRFGVDMTFVVSTEALRGSMQAGNAWLAAQIKERPKFKGYCVLHPLMLEQSVEEERKYLFNEKFVGAMIHESALVRPLYSDPMRNLVKSLLRYSGPLLLKINEPRQLNDLELLAKEFPSQKFMILHMADDMWQSALSMASQLLNITIEIGGANADNDKIAAGFAAVGANRMVFGSGMPLISPVYAMGIIRDSSISASDKDRILDKNAKKIFGLT
jgi:predicted TIM-barrel fold metal-dependent hydrolase